MSENVLIHDQEDSDFLRFEGAHVGVIVLYAYLPLSPQVDGKARNAGTGVSRK